MFGGRAGLGGLESGRLAFADRGSGLGFELREFRI